MTELNELLILATDRIESPRLEQVALKTARRRLTRRRGVAAAAVASTLVVTVVVGMGGGDRGSSPPPSAPSGQTPNSAPPTTPLASGEKLWPAWDPRDVDQLPPAPDQVAPAIPDVIDPPHSSPLLSDDPVTSAVVAVEHDGVAQVLGTDGGWRTVPIDGRYPIISLSPDGTRFAVHYYFDSRTPEHDYGVTVHDLATGDIRTLQPPEGFQPWDNSGWSFIDEDRLVFRSGPKAYVVVESGRAEETKVLRGTSTTMDPAGNWLTSADFTEPNVLTDYAGATPREVSMDRTGRLSWIQADEDTVVGTTYDDRPFSVVVADRETLTPQFRLPVVDHDANYSNWGLGTVAVADNGTVLMQVAAIGRQVEGFRLVAWDPASGELSMVSSTALPVESSVVIAHAMLRAIGPG